MQFLLQHTLSEDKVARKRQKTDAMRISIKRSALSEDTKMKTRCSLIQHKEDSGEFLSNDGNIVYMKKIENRNKKNHNRIHYTKSCTNPLYKSILKNEFWRKYYLLDSWKRKQKTKIKQTHSGKACTEILHKAKRGLIVCKEWLTNLTKTYFFSSKSSYTIHHLRTSFWLHVYIYFLFKTGRQL